jgi:hypothetical protein
MPSRQRQVVVRVTDEQLAWLQSLAEIRNTTIANVIMTPFNREHPEFVKLARVRQWTRKAKLTSKE